MGDTLWFVPAQMKVSRNNPSKEENCIDAAKRKRSFKRLDSVVKISHFLL